MNLNLAKELNSYQKSIERYFSRMKRSKIFFHNARKISFEEIFKSTEWILRNPHPLKVMSLIKTMTTSGIWISHSFARYLFSLVDFEKKRYETLTNPLVQKILKRVSIGEKIESELASEKDIFQAIYMEREYIHHHPHDTSILSLPKINSTLVLVDGVLNEIFSTTMFERALKNLFRLYGLKYFIPDIQGIS